MRFDSCWERIRRAGERLNGFEKIHHRLLKERPYTPAIQHERDGTIGVYIRGEIETIPVSVSLDLGEALYQLRSALDAAIFYCGVQENLIKASDDEKKWQFPICLPGRAGCFDSAMGKMPLCKDRTEIIRAVQPCYAPVLPDECQVINYNRALAFLDHIAMIDRHRHLHFIRNMITSRELAVHVPDGIAVVSLIPINGETMRNEHKIATLAEIWRPNDTDEIVPDIDFTIDITIDKIEPPVHPNDSLINRIKGIFWACKAIVSSLESAAP